MKYVCTVYSLKNSTVNTCQSKFKLRSRMLPIPWKPLYGLNHIPFLIVPPLLS